MAFKNLLILSIFTICVAAATAAHHHAAAPAPTVDCSNLIMNLVDCLTFVSNGSTATKPEKTCCSGLKTVLQTDAECLCEGFKNSAQIGVVLNVTKALTLPAACKINAPPASNCGLALSPAGAPGVSPSTPSTPGSLPGLSPQASAPAPIVGAAHGVIFSVGSFVAGVVILFFGL